MGEAPTHPGGKQNAKGGGSVVGTLIVVLLVAALTGGIGWAVVSWWSRPHVYDLSSPERVVASAREMLERGEAGRLSELLETTSDNERRLYRQLGAVLGDLQKLGATIRDEMPQEVERHRKEVAEAAARGEAVTLFQRLAAARQGKGPNLPDQGGVEIFRGSPQRDRFNDVIMNLLADPYKWIEESEERIEYVEIDEEQVALTWDGQMIPPVGLIMRRQVDGTWRVVPPLEAPFVNRITPQNEAEYQIWGSLLASMDNMIVELDAEVRRGQHATFESVADSAFEKAAIPTAMIMFAYQKAMRERGHD
ncbi:MAG: hypothetical protein R3B57_10220 [Phycisphaerales bacterium]